MKLNGRIVAIAAALVVALAVVGAGIAQAVGGGEESVTGPAAQQAGDAALAAVGGGTVLEVEQADAGDAAYEVEVRRPDGSEVEVHLDAQFQPLGTAADDDQGESGTDDDDQGEQDGDDD
jgi:hypothetical protein